jgi:hypothetical protein
MSPYIMGMYAANLYLDGYKKRNLLAEWASFIIIWIVVFCAPNGEIAKWIPNWLLYLDFHLVRQIFGAALSYLLL